jgi:hypothetical protein
LPHERQEGLRRRRTHLEDPDVKRVAHSWLVLQPAGTIKPQNFVAALNSSILPSLNVALKRPLGVRTGRCWLRKLGYCYIKLKKGMYMDGHECEDVVVYWKEHFFAADAEV